jgi:hypothetical protein
MDVPKSLASFSRLMILVILVGCSPNRLPTKPLNEPSPVMPTPTVHTAAEHGREITLASKSLLPNFVGGAPTRTQEAYQFAIAYPDELKNYPCYCGCVSQGHRDNLDCYISEIDKTGKISFDTHAVGCAICADITQDVMRLMREGRSTKDIRTYIDDQYRASGPSTNTPLPVS